MKVAILGAGFSGLAVAWEFLKKPECMATLFDPKGIGGGASGVAAGLLHPFGGSRAKLNRLGREGMEAAQELLHIAEAGLGSPVSVHNGLIRLALTEEQKADFALCASLYPDVDWLEPEDIRKRLPGIAYSPGICIHSAVTVDCRRYLKGLWASCEQKGAVFQKMRPTLSECEKNFDLVIIAAGYESKLLEGLADLPLTPVKGQMLELAWPSDEPPLSTPVSSQAYVVMSEDKKRCYAGATFEKDFQDDQPDLKAAMKYLKPKITAVLPFLEGAEILSCRAGIRASAPGHMPLLKHLWRNVWILTGMGSKGLLYHAYYAKKIGALVAFR